ncbi:hypothetical protein BGX38DRAFT_1264624 [Terfezia claveryi]|nr:hypothetical protein BGX38DRAFT_1264624 [Terfezia claveryi]
MLAKYFFVAAAAIVGGVMAVKCDAQTQFDHCKQDMKKTYLDPCTAQDYSCLCKGNKIILNNCYTLCPQDDGKASQESVVSSWCVSAGGDKTSSVPIPTKTTTGATGTATGTGTSYPSDTETSTSTGTSEGGNKTGTETTTTPTSTSGSAGNMLAPAGFMVAAAAVAGLVL